jgi:hypothetical protein
MATREQCVLGFVAKTGRAVVVALQPGPVMVAKWGLQLTPPNQERFVFHAAQDMTLPKAEKWVRDSTKNITEQTASEIDAVFESVPAKVGAAAVVGTNIEMDDSVASILGSHTKLHTAEGVLYRSAIVDALRQHRITPLLVPAPDLDEIRGRLDQFGKVEAPWRREHKDATLAALLALDLGVKPGRASGRGSAPRTPRATSPRRSR